MELSPPQAYVESRQASDKMIPLVVLIFILQVILLWPVFTPNLHDVGSFDEADYIESGRLLGMHSLPALNRYPAATFLFALTYLPVRGSDFWLAYSCGIGRFILFALLWLSAYLAARQISGFSNPLVMIGFLLFSPIPAVLARNGAHALFTAMSVFALARLISFYRGKELRDLAIASGFMGLAVLSRMGEGTVVFLCFVALSVFLGVFSGRILQTLAAAIVPCAVIVGGYMIIFYALTGTSPLGTSHYLYLVFEEGQGMADREKFAGQNFWVEGAAEARELFGTAEQNHYSVITAIRRNPAAYLYRVPRLALAVVTQGMSGYGGPLSLWLLLLILQGCIDLVRKKDFILLSIFLLWPSYWVVFVLLDFQESQLLMPFPALFCLASIGLTGVLSFSKKQQYFWSALLLLLTALAIIGNTTLAYMFSPLVFLLVLWIVWMALNRYGSAKPILATAFVFLFCTMSLFRENASSQRLRTFGTTPDERAVVFLKRNFDENAAIASYSPNASIAARMTYIELTGVDTRGVIESEEDLQRWMLETKVEAFYVDSSLQRYEPPLWRLIENQIGKSLEVVFSSDTPYIQILRIKRGADLNLPPAR
jgi:hypothetical protein